MKRYLPALGFVLGISALLAMLSPFTAAQPNGLSITRAEARRLADVEARRLGIDVDHSWPVVTWDGSDILEDALKNDPAARRSAISDPVLGPRLFNFTVTYFRRNAEKRPEYGYVLVGTRGEILGARRIARAEETGPAADRETLQRQADAFVHSRVFPGAPHPQLESIRPAIQRARTDHTFRYLVPSTFPAGKVQFLLNVYFTADKLTGWSLMDEYRDGSNFRFNGADQITSLVIRMGLLLGLLFVLLSLFLKKYHAGEVGVGTGAVLFGTVLSLLVVDNFLSFAEDAANTQFGGTDAFLTAVALGSFRFLFYDIAFAVLTFFAWSVGESYARERWGDRLASFDAVMRHDLLNATVGGSILRGLLWAPAVAAASLLPPYLAVLSRFAYPTLGPLSAELLNSTGGPLTVVVGALIDAIAYPLILLLFVLALANRRRVLGAGIVIATLLGAAGGVLPVPIGPELLRSLLGFGGTAALVAIFLSADLLTTVCALFVSTLLVAFLPVLIVSSGAASTGILVGLVTPLLVLIAAGLAGIGTGREVSYSYEELAPHVRRIAERERVKAEIDAANRIQAALLPSTDPQLEGVGVSSHYRAASEIGGDYFDFLPLPAGLIGVAFGDVAGHGLTSGIVMAMAKSALLVQVGYDASPFRVMEVLNEIVIKTAPKRMLMTFFFGVLDPATRTLRFSSAGHLDPYVYRSATRKLETLSSWGFPLGVRRRDPFQEHAASFAEGDRLVLYSDGLIEALDDDGEPFGFHRFESVVVEHGSDSAEQLKRALLQAVRKFTRNRPAEDDQTLVVISFDGERAPVRARVPSSDPVFSA